MEYVSGTKSHDYYNRLGDFVTQINTAKPKLDNYAIVCAWAKEGQNGLIKMFAYLVPHATGMPYADFFWGYKSEFEFGGYKHDFFTRVNSFLLYDDLKNYINRLPAPSPIAQVATASTQTVAYAPAPKQPVQDGLVEQFLGHKKALQGIVQGYQAKEEENKLFSAERRFESEYEYLNAVAGNVFLFSKFLDELGLSMDIPVFYCPSGHRDYAWYEKQNKCFLPYLQKLENVVKDKITLVETDILPTIASSMHGTESAIKYLKDFDAILRHAEPKQRNLAFDVFPNLVAKKAEIEQLLVLPAEKDVLGEFVAELQRIYDDVKATKAANFLFHTKVNASPVVSRYVATLSRYIG